MDLLALPNTRKREIAEWVLTLYDEKRGGFGGNTGHDAHILYTQHAVYVLAQCGELEMIEDKKERIVKYIASLQREDGSFAGGAFFVRPSSSASNSPDAKQQKLNVLFKNNMSDEWGEIDTRFTYCAAVALAVLNRLDAVDQQKVRPASLLFCVFFHPRR